MPTPSSSAVSKPATSATRSPSVSAASKPMVRSSRARTPLINDLSSAAAMPTRSIRWLSSRRHGLILSGSRGASVPFEAAVYAIQRRPLKRSSAPRSLAHRRRDLAAHLCRSEGLRYTRYSGAPPNVHLHRDLSSQAEESRGASVPFGRLAVRKKTKWVTHATNQKLRGDAGAPVSPLLCLGYL